MTKGARNYIERRIKWLRGVARDVLKHYKKTKEPLFEGWYWDIVCYTNEIERKLKEM